MMDPAFVSILTDLGLPGVIIWALGWTCWRMAKRIDDLQEKRLTELRAVIDTTHENTRSLDALAELVRSFSGSGRP